MYFHIIFAFDKPIGRTCWKKCCSILEGKTVTIDTPAKKNFQIASMVLQDKNTWSAFSSSTTQNVHNKSSFDSTISLLKLSRDGSQLSLTLHNKKFTLEGILRFQTAEKKSLLWLWQIEEEITLPILSNTCPFGLPPTLLTWVETYTLE